MFVQNYSWSGFGAEQVPFTINITEVKEFGKRKDGLRGLQIKFFGKT